VVEAREAGVPGREGAALRVEGGETLARLPGDSVQELAPDVQRRADAQKGADRPVRPRAPRAVDGLADASPDVRQVRATDAADRLEAAGDVPPPATVVRERVDLAARDSREAADDRAGRRGHRDERT